jgi:hypothetical protein
MDYGIPIIATMKIMNFFIRHNKYKMNSQIKICSSAISENTSIF